MNWQLVPIEQELSYQKSMKKEWQLGHLNKAPVSLGTVKPALRPDPLV